MKVTRLEIGRGSLVESGAEEVGVGVEAWLMVGEGGGGAGGGSGGEDEGIFSLNNNVLLSSAFI